MDALEHIIINAVVAIFLREFARLGQQIDWAKLKELMDKKVRQFIPGTTFDDAAQAIADAAFEALKHAFTPDELAKLTAHYRKASDEFSFANALLYVRDVMHRLWSPWPVTPAQHSVVAALTPARLPKAPSFYPKGEAQVVAETPPAGEAQTTHFDPPLSQVVPPVVEAALVADDDKPYGSADA